MSPAGDERISEASRPPPRRVALWALPVAVLVLVTVLPTPARASEVIPLCSGTSCGWENALVPANITAAQTPLRAVKLFPDDVAVAVGNLGTVMRSTDGGRTYGWVSFPESTIGLNALAEDPFGTLWVGGDSGLLAVSHDEGAYWSIFPATGIAGNISSLGFPTSTFAYAATSDGFYLSSDDGQTWILDATLGSGWARAAAFYDAADGWVDFGISPVVDYTSDGGHSFASSLPEGSGNPSLAAAFVPTGTSSAWYLGQDGSVYTTTNGVNWKISDHGIGEKASGLALINGTSLWEVAGEGNIYYSPDDGSCWLEQPVPSIPDLDGVSFLNSNHGVTVGDGAAMYTEDGGSGTATNYTYPSSAAPVGGPLALFDPVLRAYDSDDGPLPPCSAPRPYDYDVIGSAIGVGVGAAIVTGLLMRRQERRSQPPKEPPTPSAALQRQELKLRHRNRRKRYVGG